MSKEVRLNDKIWYGKYRGRTIRDIVESDLEFLDDLVKKGKITFHKNVQDYLKGDDSPKKNWWENGNGDYHYQPHEWAYEPPSFVYGSQVDITATTSNTDAE